MTGFDSALARLCADLDARRVDWAVVGGLAVSARVEPRFTRDIDLAVAVSDDAAAEALVRSLVAVGYRLLASIEQDKTGRLAAVRLIMPAEIDSGIVVDLLFASSGIEPEVVAAAEVLEVVPGFSAPIARSGHLLALKLLARDDRTRPQDLGDIRSLVRAMTDADVALAGQAVELLMTRGAHRGRNLPAALADALNEHR